MGGDEGADEPAGALELAAGELRAASQLAQRDAGGVADGVERSRDVHVRVHDPLRR